MSNVSKSSSLLSAMTARLASTAENTFMEEEVRLLYSRLPTPITYPFYHKNTLSLLPHMPDKYLSLLLPIVIYWLASLWFLFLDTAQIPFFEKYRLHESQEVTKRNRVSAKRVVVMVLVQQFFQTIVGLLALDGEEVSRMQVFQDHEANVSAIGFKVAKLVTSVAGLSTGVKVLNLMGANFANWIYWWGIPSLQFLWAL
jgi:sphinganine C4-monooxygenase